MRLAVVFFVLFCFRKYSVDPQFMKLAKIFRQRYSGKYILAKMFWQRYSSKSILTTIISGSTVQETGKESRKEGAEDRPNVSVIQDISSTLMFSYHIIISYSSSFRYKGYLEVVELVMESATGCEKLPRMDMDESCKCMFVVHI